MILSSWSFAEFLLVKTKTEIFIRECSERFFHYCLFSYLQKKKMQLSIFRGIRNVTQHSTQNSNSTQLKTQTQFSNSTHNSSQQLNSTQNSNSDMRATSKVYTVTRAKIKAWAPDAYQNIDPARKTGPGFVCRNSAKRNWGLLMQARQPEPQSTNHQPRVSAPEGNFFLYFSALRFCVNWVCRVLKGAR